MIFLENTASQEDIFHHLKECDKYYIPHLSSRVNLKDYAKKLFAKAKIFEAWDSLQLIGCVAAYCDNENDKTVYISNVSVLSSYKGQGVAKLLLTNLMHFSKKNGFKSIRLEVNKDNLNAIALYNRFNFRVCEKHEYSIILCINL